MEVIFRLTQFSRPTNHPLFRKIISGISLKPKQTEPKCTNVESCNYSLNILFMLGSRAGPSPKPPTRERPPNLGAKIYIYIGDIGKM